MFNKEIIGTYQWEYEAESLIQKKIDRDDLNLLKTIPAARPFIINI